VRDRTLAKDLKRRGWRFVGPTTVYAFMQVMGLVNDHVHGCNTREPVEQARAAFVPSAQASRITPATDQRRPL
jgi:DNA-3-methyladenine glycosylase I